MSILGWLTAPIRAYQSVVHELRSVRAANQAKLAALYADIQTGKIAGPELDAVTECLEAQSVNLKKKETDRIRKEAV